MSRRKIVFSPVTRLSGHLSIEIVVDGGHVKEANVSSTMFRGYEKIMENRHITDAVYLTQRICGICSLAHGATASYLLDTLYDNRLSKNAQYLRNIMYGADILQNHLRHFYLFCLPDYVKMPDSPPFHRQNLADARLNPEDNQRLAEHYFEGVKASQKCHQILALFGGKAPHQHSFLHGGVAVGPNADNISQALALLQEVHKFIRMFLLPDIQLLAKVYRDYFQIGITPGHFFSAGLFKFGAKNEQNLWPAGILVNGQLETPNWELVEQDITNAWFQDKDTPDPYKKRAYTWVKAVQYAGQPLEGGPLARMIISGQYQGGSSTMDRICARGLETLLIAELMDKWLHKLKPGKPPLQQKKELVREKATSVTDAMRGVLLHRAVVEKEQIVNYKIITPTMWNFSPKDRYSQLGPAEKALTGTKIPKPELLFTILGRIVRSFDPCMSCATHVLDIEGKVLAEEEIF